VKAGPPPSDLAQTSAVCAMGTGLPEGLWGIVLETVQARGLLLLVGLPGSGRTRLLENLLVEVHACGMAVGEKIGHVENPEGIDVVVLDDVGYQGLYVLETLFTSLSRRQGPAVIATMNSWLDPDSERWRDSVLGLGARSFSIPQLPEELMRVLAENLVPAGMVVDDVSGAGGDPGLLQAVIGARPPADAICLSDIPLTVRMAQEHIPLLARLDSRTRELFHVAALCENLVSVRALVHGCGRGDLEVIKFLRLATETRVLQDVDEGWRFRQSWLAEILRKVSPKAEVRARHAVIARGLMRDGAPARETLHHLLASSDRGPAVIDWVVQELTAQIGEDPHSALEALERLLSNTEPRFIGRERVRNLLARAYAVAGRASDVERLVVTSMADGVRSNESIPLLLHFSEALLRDDDVTRAVDVLTSVEAVQNDDSLERNQLIATRGLHRVLAGDLNTGEQEAWEALAHGEVLGDDLGVSIAFSALAHVNYYRGFLQVAVEVAESAVLRADMSDSDEARRRSRYELGMFLIHADLPSQAAQVLDHELERIDRLAVAWHRPLPYVGLGLIAFYSGQWDLALSHLQNVVRFGELVSTRWEVTAVRAHMAVISIERGNLGHAVRFLDGAEVTNADTPHHGLDTVFWARALLAETLGQHAEAFDLLQQACSLVVRYGVVSRLRWLGPDLLRVARKINRVDECAEVAALLDEVAVRADTAYVTGAALRTRALLENRTDLALQAVDVLGSSGRPIERAAAQLDAARLLSQEFGVTAEVGRLYAEATAAYQSVGAMGRLIALKSEMKVLGLSSAPERRARTTHGLASLTPTEQRIREFVAQGLSNPEIASAMVISRRTVETHLTHIFAKIGVKSRVALALGAAEGLARQIANF